MKDSKPDKAHKRQWHLVPLRDLEPIVEAFEHGASKGYEAESWKHSTYDEAQTKYGDALIRHMEAHQAGDLIDEESGLPHVYHAAACAVMLCYHERTRGDREFVRNLVQEWMFKGMPYQKVIIDEAKEKSKREAADRTFEKKPSPVGWRYPNGINVELESDIYWVYNQKELAVASFATFEAADRWVQGGMK